jgi:hypothetical protein
MRQPRGEWGSTAGLHKAAQPMAKRGRLARQLTEWKRRDATTTEAKQWN